MVFDDLQNAAVLHHLEMATMVLTHKGKFAEDATGEAPLLEKLVEFHNGKADALSKGIITEVGIA